jgi:hypothetical protein
MAGMAVHRHQRITPNSLPTRSKVARPISKSAGVIAIVLGP